jgi:DNA polymerase III delta prime subunit
MYRFKPIPQKLICNKLKDICIKENTIISDDTINLVEKISRGDLRKAINYLQRCRNFKNFLDNTNNINIINNIMIENISGIIPLHLIQDFINVCLNNDMDKAEYYINLFIKEAYSLTIIIPYILDIIIQNTKLNDNVKSILVQNILSIDNYLVNGCNETIQFNRLAYNLMYYNNYLK